MDKDRLEAFSDGVMAIIITIMVLELRPPEAPALSALLPLLPVFFSYALSFIFVGIYWNNHHHMLKGASKVDGRVLWTNLHLLFWLSLIPFGTAWMDDALFASGPVALYGIILLMCGFSYYLLERALTAVAGQTAVLAKALGSKMKERIALMAYAVAVPAAYLSPWISIAMYVFVAVIWFVPDQRIERQLN
jgi:uncharacterized membrane protein